jgi:AraC-like DNA-binding protein
MEKKNIQDVNVSRAKVLGASGYIENDILLLDKLNEAPIPQEPRRMNMIVVALCLKGKAQYTIDTQEQLVRKNDVLIISERHVMDNFMASPDLEGLAIILSVGFFKDIIQNVSDISSLFLFSQNHPVINFSQKEADVFISYFNLIKQKMTDTENLFRRDVVRTLLLAMFYDLSNVIFRTQQNHDNRQSRADIIFTKFIRLVEENYKRERRVGWYAEQLCITPKYLSETVKQVSRRTPNEWIDNYVILEIRVLLKNSTKSIKEISMNMNFPNQSFLGKFFKEHVGMSPSEYRRN